MAIDKETMELAAPYLMEAERHIDTLKYFIRNRDRISLDARVPMYFQKLVEAVASMQLILYDEQSFVEVTARTVAEVSKGREYHFTTTKNKDGELFFDIHALLPLDKVQKHMLLTGGEHETTLTVPRSDYARSDEDT